MRDILLTIVIALLVVHTLVMYSIRFYDHNISALIRISAEENREALSHYVKKGMVVFNDEGGYDGQAYYYVAMDPFLAKGHFKSPYRQQRILYPLLSRIFALGDAGLLPHTMYLVNLVSLSLGIIFFSLILRSFSLSPYWSLFYALSPPSIMTIQYDLPSPLAMALIIAAVYFYLHKRVVATTLLMALALLTREDSAMILAPLILWDYQQKRSLRRVALLLSSLIPFFLWQFFIALKLGHLPTATSATVISPVPLSGITGYVRTLGFESAVEMARGLSTIIVFIYFVFVSLTMAHALKRTGHLFYYVVAAYCVLVLFTVPSQWNNFNGLTRMFYGLFTFLPLSYCIERNRMVGVAVLFTGILFLMTVIRIIFVSPVYPYRIW